MKQFISGHQTPVSKKSEWALFHISDMIIAPIRSGDFAGFSKTARIVKPVILCDFKGWNS
jgi:hypothetical protein